MKFSPLLKAAAASSIVALALTGCAVNETGSSDSAATADATLSGSFVGAGASSQDAAQQAWIAAFQTENSAVNVDYDPSGSGAGRETFQKGAAAFSGSDRAFTAEELAAGPFATCAADSGIVELPLYISPIAIIFNLDGVDELNLDAATVAKIFTGEITSWDDPAIAEQNPDAALPSTAITPVHRSDKSGTTGNFTDYLSAVAGDVWTDGSVEEWPLTSGEAAQGTSGLVDAVSNGVGTIGYADASRAGDLGTVNIKVGDDYVSYSPEAAAAIVDASPLEEGRGATDLAIKLDRTSTADGVYPIVLVSYLIGCEAYEDAANAEFAKAYFEMIASEEGQQVSAEAAGSAPISADLRGQIETAIASIK